MKPYIWRIHDIPWIWCNLAPQMRWFIRPGNVGVPDDGHAYAYIERDDLTYSLKRTWEHEIRMELQDPEWPSPYWEAKENIMSDAIE